MFFKKQKALEKRITKIEEARAEAAKLEKQETCSHRWLYTNEYNSNDRSRSATSWSRRCRNCGLYQMTCEIDVIKDLCQKNGIDVYQQIPKHDIGYPYDFKLVVGNGNDQ